MIVLAAAIVAYDMPLLRNEQQKHGKWVYTLTLTAGVTLAILRILRLPIPNPLDLLTLIFQPASQWINQLLM
jgi:hypothetical protein